MATTLKHLVLNEVSLVDRGANQHARITLFKREFSADDRKRLAGSGAALPDGSFPIENKSDLSNAIRAIGRASDPAAARRHIIARAKTLGATDALPEGWSVSKSDRDKPGSAHEGDGQMTKEEMEAAVALAKAEADKVKADLEKAQHTVALLQMTPEHKSYMEDAGMDDAAKKAFVAKSADERSAHIAKDKVFKRESEHVQKLATENEAMKKRLESLENDKAATAFAKRATDLGMPEQMGDVLRKAYSGDAAAITKLEQTIKGLAAQQSTAKLFAEFGSASAASATAEDQIKAKAEEYRKTAAGASLTYEQAYAKVYADPANVEITKAVKAEELAKRRAA